MDTIELFDRHGRAVTLQQNAGGAWLYQLDGASLTLATRDDERALDVLGMHDAPDVPPAADPQPDTPGPGPVEPAP